MPGVSIFKSLNICIIIIDGVLNLKWLTLRVKLYDTILYFFSVKICFVITKYCGLHIYY